MNTDIRISVDFYTHPKTRMLEKRLAFAASRSLVILWTWAAKCRPDGNLRGLSDEAIEAAAMWDGPDNDFINALHDIGWVDGEEHHRELHDWAIHNSWAAGETERGDKARLSRMAQLYPELYQQLVSQGRDSISKEEYEALIHPQRQVNDRSTSVNESPAVVQESFSAPPAPAPYPVPKPALKNKNKDKETPYSPPGEEIQPEACPPCPSEASPPVMAPMKRTPGTAKAEPEKYTAEFLRFWAEYPRPVDKLRAFEVWKRLLPDEHERVITAARNYSAEMRRLRKDAEYIRHPKTFLSKDGWLDWEGGASGVQDQGGIAVVTDAERKAIIAKHTNEEGQRNDIAIVKEIRALERQRSVEADAVAQFAEAYSQSL